MTADSTHDLGPGWDRVQADIERREATKAEGWYPEYTASNGWVSMLEASAYRRGYWHGFLTLLVPCLLLAFLAATSGCAAEDEPPPAWTWHRGGPMAFDTGGESGMGFIAQAIASGWHPYTNVHAVTDYRTEATITMLYEPLAGRDAEARAWQRSDGRWQYELALDIYAAGDGGRIYPAAAFEVGRLFGLWCPDGQGNGGLMDHYPTAYVPAMSQVPMLRDGELVRELWGAPGPAVREPEID